MQDYRAIIKRAREQRGMSQHKLAKELKITQTFVSEIESGRKTPSLEVFFRICQALEIRLFPDEPQGEDGAPDPGTEPGKGA